MAKISAKTKTKANADAKADPCIAVCRFDGRTGWCFGCGRTLAEIRAWRTLTPYRRTALARDLPRRVERVRANDPEGPPARGGAP